MSARVIWEEGYLLIKREGKYLFWNSFKAEWQWGPRRLSERFLGGWNDPLGDKLIEKLGGKYHFERMRNKYE
jgi:hypothetical protein